MSDEEEEEKSRAPTSTCKFTFNKRRVVQRTARKKIESDEGERSSDTSEEETVVVKKKERKGTDHSNPMIQRTLSRKSWRSEKDAKNDDEDEAGPRIKKGRIAVSYASTRTEQREGPSDMGATSTVQTETEKEKDAQALFEKAQEINKGLKGKEDDRLYRGLNNYAQYYEKRDTAQGNASSGMVRKGPIRAPENLRATVRWDYQPDICKDYKETGFCGFGDSCKFMHDRSDYKHGWQLEREMQEHRYGGEDVSKYEVDSDEDQLPFKCYICRKSFKDPIITKCKHYFCEKCALQHYRKSQRCYVCGQQTNGVFNPAKEIIARIKNEEEEEEKEEEVKEEPEEGEKTDSSDD